MMPIPDESIYSVINHMTAYKIMPYWMIMGISRFLKGYTGMVRSV
jgi:hypothetical protein